MRCLARSEAKHSIFFLTVYLIQAHAMLTETQIIDDRGLAIINTDNVTFEKLLLIIQLDAPLFKVEIHKPEFSQKSNRMVGRVGRLEECTLLHSYIHTWYQEGRTGAKGPLYHRKAYLCHFKKVLFKRQSCPAMQLAPLLSSESLITECVQAESG